MLDTFETAAIQALHDQQSGDPAAKERIEFQPIECVGNHSSTAHEKTDDETERGCFFQANPLLLYGYLLICIKRGLSIMYTRFWEIRYTGLGTVGISEGSETNMKTFDARLPVTLVTGPLGSGKTTLLNRILQENHGIKFGVIVNEFGELSIDHHLLSTNGEPVVELANGCICCTVRDDLLDAVTQMLKRSAGVEVLVVETTGLADPRPVAQTLLHEEICEDVRLDAILTVLDAEQFHDNLLRSGTTIDQILAGDILLLNKVDLVSDAMRAEIKEEIGDMNPAARLLETVQAAVDLRLLLDLEVKRGQAGCELNGAEQIQDQYDPSKCLDSDGLDGHQANLQGDFVPLAELSASVHGGSHLHREEITSVSFTTTQAFDYERLGDFLESLPPHIFRGKGLLWIEGYEEQLLFHLVGSRSTAVLHDPWPAGPRASKLVLIGHHLDREQIVSSLENCLLS